MALNRNLISALTLSASAFVGLVSYEGYSDKAYVPVPGDVPTIGFGTTQGVKLGDKITPVAALRRAIVDISSTESAVKHCVKVPLKQGEYDAYIQLSYNIGTSAFCKSTLVRKLNSGDYKGACNEILKWNKFQGKENKGLSNRRSGEYQTCITE